MKHIDYQERLVKELVAAEQEAQQHRSNRGGRPQDPVAASAASYILPMHHTPMFYEHPARR